MGTAWPGQTRMPSSKNTGTPFQRKRRKSGISSSLKSSQTGKRRWPSGKRSTDFRMMISNSTRTKQRKTSSQDPNQRGPSRSDPSRRGQNRSPSRSPRPRGRRRPRTNQRARARPTRLARAGTNPRTRGASPKDDLPSETYPFSLIDVYPISRLDASILTVLTTN